MQKFNKWIRIRENEEFFEPQSENIEKIINDTKSKLAKLRQETNYASLPSGTDQKVTSFIMHYLPSIGKTSFNEGVRAIDKAKSTLGYMEKYKGNLSDYKQNFGNLLEKEMPNLESAIHALHAAKNDLSNLKYLNTSGFDSWGRPTKEKDNPKMEDMKYVKRIYLENEKVIDEYLQNLIDFANGLLEIYRGLGNQINAANDHKPSAIEKGAKAVGRFAMNLGNRFNKAFPGVFTNGEPDENERKRFDLFKNS
jgi:hypothetical protein